MGIRLAESCESVGVLLRCVGAACVFIGSIKCITNLVPLRSGRDPGCSYRHSNRTASAKWVLKLYPLAMGMSSSQLPFANPLDTVLLVGAFSTAVLLGFAWVLCTNQEKCRNVFKFMWSCFMKPFSHGDSGWGGALESFYAGQADVYDATRHGLLKGRTTMMRLAAAHLSAGMPDKEQGNLVWVDVMISQDALY